MIAPKPKATVKSADAFINAAPDAKPAAPVAKDATRRIKANGKTTMTFDIDPALLEKLDEKAREIGLSRTQYVTFALRESLDRKLKGFG